MSVVPSAGSRRALPARAPTSTSPCPHPRWQCAAKGALDRVGAVALLVVLLPLLTAVALAVAATSPGPALYRQRRLGRDGAPFAVLKFRTMVPDAEAHRARLAHKNDGDGLLFKIQDDPRVTAVGRFLRRSSLDELPQLWNVVRGEMSLVGPRPLPVRESDLVGVERRRLEVRPGITGLWQVSGRSELSWTDTVRLDAHYVEEWSLRGDIVILMRTPLVVVRGRGAY